MKVIYAFLFFTVFLSGCAVTIYSDMDTSNNFDRYKSFAWYPKPSAEYKNSMFDNQIIESNVKNYASSELKLRGYRVDIDSADILLDYDIMVEKKVDQQQIPIYSHPYNYNYYGNYNYNGGYYNGYNNRYYNGGGNMIPPPPYIIGYKTIDVPYQEGTLTISAIDRRTNKLVWKGWAVGTVTDEQTYEYELHSDIRRIFKQYPVKIIKVKRK